MKDVITYCENIPAMVAEIAEKFPERLSEDGKFLVTKIPTVVVRSAGKSLCLVRCLDDQEYADLDSLENLEVLGTYEEVFSDPEKLAKYDSVYDRSPRILHDDKGSQYTYTPPDKIGVFA